MVSNFRKSKKSLSSGKEEIVKRADPSKEGEIQLDNETWEKIQDVAYHLGVNENEIMEQALLALLKGEKGNEVVSDKKKGKITDLNSSMPMLRVKRLYSKLNSTQKLKVAGLYVSLETEENPTRINQLPRKKLIEEFTYISAFEFFEELEKINKPLHDDIVSERKPLNFNQIFKLSQKKLPKKILDFDSLKALLKDTGVPTKEVNKKRKAQKND